MTVDGFDSSEAPPNKALQRMIASTVSQPPTREYSLMKQRCIEMACTGDSPQLRASTLIDRRP